MSLFEDAKPRPPIERRPLVDSPDEVHELRELSAQINNTAHTKTKTVIGLIKAQRFAELYARQHLRRELIALRRRVEEWAADLHDEGTADTVDTIQLLRDLVTVLDDRFMHSGGIEKGTE